MKTVATLLVFVSLAIVATEGKIVLLYIYISLTQHILLLCCFKVIISIIYFYHPPGKPGIGIQRCLCRGAGLKMVMPKLIEKVEIHPVSPTCAHLEVVVTMKNGVGRRCLNPESLFTQNIIKRITKKSMTAQ
uniref:C-X-C motif chemokine 11-1-like n=2 Tax=Cyprinus carpio TaxID=7962 RepID=A0A8C1IVN6_CYPCA